MTQFETWPPPKWAEVVITWDKLLITGHYHPMMSWVKQYPGGRYHLHGYKSTEGFAFRFEQSQDATAFTLRWS
jgi:hypothetical protein